MNRKRVQNSEIGLYYFVRIKNLFTNPKIFGFVLALWVIDFWPFEDGQQENTIKK